MYVHLLPLCCWRVYGFCVGKSQTARMLEYTVCSLWAVTDFNNHHTDFLNPLLPQPSKFAAQAAGVCNWLFVIACHETWLPPQSQVRCQAPDDGDVWQEAWERHNFHRLWQNLGDEWWWVADRSKGTLWRAFHDESELWCRSWKHDGEDYQWPNDMYPSRTRAVTHEAGPMLQFLLLTWAPVTSWDSRIWVESCFDRAFSKSDRSSLWGANKNSLQLMHMVLLGCWTDKMGFDSSLRLPCRIQCSAFDLACSVKVHEWSLQECDRNLAVLQHSVTLITVTPSTSLPLLASCCLTANRVWFWLVLDFWMKV